MKAPKKVWGRRDCSGECCERMSNTAGPASADARVLTGPEKAPTGIKGFDEITNGGLPRGRPTLVTGAAGSGKTLFGIEFLVRGARDFGEPGVLLAFEEAQDDLVTNVASLGFDLEQLENDGLLAIDAFRLDPAEIIETGAFDLEGLFIRLQMAVESVGAKRVVLDTIELLFSALPNEAIIRGELGRLFRWLKDRDLTVVITGERGKLGNLTRFGIEEYVSDCVVTLDHRVEDEISTRRLRVVKYRGSLHGTNEYPFLITEKGLVVVPITSVGLTYEASNERVSSGIPRLDEMLSGGVYRGSSVMISGTAGTGKTSIGALMADASCARGEKALFFSFEESPEQLIRNMASIGMDLRRWVDSGLLLLEAVRPTAFGFEEHLAMLHRLLDEHEPQLVVLDAVASLTSAGARADTTSAISRDLDLLKGRGITTVMTTLTHGESQESSEVDVSSLVDTWLLLRNQESNGERNRLLFVIKSRGSAHSNQVREFVLTDDGAELLDVYVGPNGVLTGSERIEQISWEHLAQTTRADETERRRQELAQRSAALQAQMAALQAQLTAEGAEFDRFVASEAEGRASGVAVRASQGRERSGEQAGGGR
ncbi:MAG: kaiC [Marmoricola sp.]|nr:kaiC [Marmoricola sp.]